MNSIIEFSGRLMMSSSILWLLMFKINSTLDWIILGILFLLFTAWTFNDDASGRKNDE